LDLDEQSKTGGADLKIDMKNFIVEDESEWKKVFSMSLIE